MSQTNPDNEPMALREQPDPTRFGFQPNGTYAPGRAEIKSAVSGDPISMVGGRECQAKRVGKAGACDASGIRG